MTEGNDGAAHTGGGRHKAPKAARSTRGVLIPIGAVVAVLALVGAGVYAYLGGVLDGVIDAATDGAIDGHSVAGSGTPTASTSQPTDASDPETGSALPSTIEATRETSVQGSTVEVREDVSLVDGPDIRLAPDKTMPAAGLEWRSSALVNEDGTTPAFDKPIALTGGGSVTIVGKYRLTDCPDLLPITWPSPMRIVGNNWDRTFNRIQEPLRTARAICPKAQSSAQEVRGLSGVMARARAAVVRLRWQGQSPLVINVVGSASEVAVRTRSSACNGKCIVRMGRNSVARVALRPVDRCAIGGRSNQLTLQVGRSSGPSGAANAQQGGNRVVAVQVPGLASKVCQLARS